MPFPLKYQIKLYATDTEATLDANGEATTTASPLVDVGTVTLTMYVFDLMDDDRLEDDTILGPGKRIADSLLTRQSFNIKSTFYTLSEWKTLKSNLVTIQSKMYKYIEVLDFDYKPHGTDRAIPVAIIGRSTQSVNGEKQINLELEREFVNG